MWKLLISGKNMYKFFLKIGQWEDSEFEEFYTFWRFQGYHDRTEVSMG